MLHNHKDPLKYPTLQNPYEKHFVDSFSEKIGQGIAIIFKELRKIDSDDLHFRTDK